MALQENTFKIRIIVEHGGKKYEKYRDEEGDGCHHYENVDCVAGYMAKDILSEIRRKK